MPQTDVVFTYDGTYPGLLSVVFESYRLKTKVANIIPDYLFEPNFFDSPIHVTTNQDWMKRVQKGVIVKTSKKTAKMLYRCFLSEQQGIEMRIFKFIERAIAAKQNIENNYSNENILKLHQIDKQIGREVHRMHAFVRFQETKDQLYAAWIEPDFNVLPLIGKHFKDRYPAQEWLIYDIKRKYGIHYDLSKVQFTTLLQSPTSPAGQEVMTSTELAYQDLWKVYFKAVDIPERINMKLHLQHVPKRYWKYLTEKQIHS